MYELTPPSDDAESLVENRNINHMHPAVSSPKSHRGIVRNNGLAKLTIRPASVCVHR